MRNLTVKRRKSFASCAVKLKVYIEDYSAHDLVIDDIPLRKLGNIKNGEQQTFTVDDTPARVYVIADRFSKGYCNEYYVLPEGCEDVYLEGECKYNPINGNAFRFDNNNSEGIAKNRKRNLIRGVVVLAVCFVVGCISGIMAGIISGNLGNLAPDDYVYDEKVFSAYGMSITLTDEFKKQSYEGYNLTLTTDEVLFIALKEDFDLAEGFGDYSLEEYYELVKSANSLECDGLTADKNGLKYFNYSFYDETEKTEYVYYAYPFKTDKAFWLVQFAIESENKEAYSEQIEKWAGSIAFE